MADKKTKKAQEKLVEGICALNQSTDQTTKNEVPCGENCGCKTNKSNMALRGYGFGENGGEWFFMLTGFKSKDAVESFKAGLVAWIQSENSKKESQGKEIDELLRKTPASAMPTV